ncbi:hypothetical protein MNBD_GAMMA26-2647 [hydrothermal vent metagenome]|uniref:ParD protein (Antitoxin to ParE) n=1 Tax=hydrothermal vent metagenome TaxID=652676 RepID=A0A3B1AUH1_9ZZZZ
MPTRNINLTDRYDSFLLRQVGSGRYKNMSEVVRAALNLLERREEEDEAKLEGLRRAVMAGHEAYRRGDYVEVANGAGLDQLFDNLTEQPSKP